ncbi:PQQ-binding-like beta-propeller repeat protein [Flagellimonas iocasae]|uniref:PQQ-binding-like beta-propeller repeat protein n=1 Tax=Flagellimonas iocasae TaxID=2055905 RepID=A0ABW4Y2D3_9FLAO
MRLQSVFLAAVFILALLFSGCSEDGSAPLSKNNDWGEYLGGPDRNHYSTLEQIDTSNVHQMKVAWEYHTGSPGQIQCNPIVVDGTLYGMTATTQPFAINAATGQEYWRKKSEGIDKFSTSRGLVYWADGKDKRILYTNGEWLYAVDAKTGQAISSFGMDGRTSLKKGLGETAQKKMVISNTPGTVYKNLIIMPLRVSEGADAALGHIQAFNIKTGELEWVFHTIPEPGEFGHDTWPNESYRNTEVGGANNWAGMAIDRGKGILYAPTGSAAYDFYGAKRKGSNLFANTLLALDASTGKRIWHYQLVHHDILDRDPPAPPNLVTVTHDGHTIEAVAQVTKQGFVFVFDRETGEPLFPIEERPVPVSDIPGEHSWPTQPFPTKPAPFARQGLTEADLSPYAENKEEILETLRKNRKEGPFTPLSTGGTLVFPGLDGGAEWGGAAVDPEGILYVNSNEMAWQLGLGPTASKEVLENLSEGERLYKLNCATCHGDELHGNPESGFPALTDIATKLKRQEVEAIVANGKGMMPGFSKFSDREKEALIAFLLKLEKEPKVALKEPGLKRSSGTEPSISYEINSFGKFLDSNGYPAIKPPWGTLNAIDLNTGDYLWKIPYGEYPELSGKVPGTTGAESYGGPVVTASGLLFIAGTKDSKIRAFKKTDGKLLWEAKLPAPAFATPSTYMVDGRQYVVVACGGTKLDAIEGDSYVAFALP